MDELASFFALEARLLERTSTSTESFEFGVAYLDQEHPERYYTSFLRVDAYREGLTADGLAAAAARILGDGEFVHRLVVVNDQRLAEELAPGFERLGYRVSWSVTLERYRGRGVARSVVLRAVEEARLAGASKVFIVADEDDWPKRLYERLGFDRIGRIGDFLKLKTS